MELKATSGVPLFRMTIRGYEFPDAAAVGNDPHDITWLLVSCHFTTADVSRDYSWPCLTAGEARLLADWLERVANQSPQTRSIVHHDDDDYRDNVLIFTEPHLAFSVVAYPTGRSAVVRVHVSYASFAAKDTDAPWDELYGSHLDIEMATDALIDAAAQWRGELLAFPVR